MSFDSPDLIEPAAASLEKSLEELDAGQRGQLIAKVRAFLTDHRQDLFTSPLDKPTKQALRNLKNNLKVLCRDSPNQEGRAALQICKKALNLADKIEGPRTEIPLNRRVNFEKLAAFIVKWTPPSHSLSSEEITELINSVPLDERDDCLEKISSLTAELTTQFHVAYRFIGLSMVTGYRERALVYDEFKALLKNKSHLDRLDKVLANPPLVASNELVEYAQLLTLLIKNTDTDDSAGVVQTLDELKPLNLGEIVDLIQKTAPFMKGVTHRDQFTTLLKLLKNMPPKERRDITRKATALINYDLATGKQVYNLLTTLVYMTPGERATILSKTLKLTQNNFPARVVLIVFSLLTAENIFDWKTLGGRIAQALEEIKKMPEAVQEAETFNWLNLFFKDMNHWNPHAERANRWLDKNHFLQAIIAVRDPALREKLTAKVVESAQQHDIRTRFRNLQKGSRPEKILLHLLLANLQEQDLSDEAIYSLKRHLSQEAFSDNLKIKILIGVLLQLIDQKELSPGTKSKIVNHLSKQNPTEAARQAQRLQAILKFQGSKKLETADEPYDFDKILKDLFEAAVSVSEIPDFSTRYAEIFEKYRDPLAVPTYTAQLNSLGSFERADMQGENAKFLRAALMGEYPAVRYQTEDNPHLKFLEEQGWGELLNKWQLNTPPEPLNDLLRSPETTKAPELADLLKTKILSNQNFPHDKESRLQSFLEALKTKDTARQKEIQLLLGKELSNKEISREQRTRLNLQSYCIKLARGQDPKGSIKALKNLLGVNFVSALKEIEQLYDRFTQTALIEEKYKGCQIVITDNAEDLLMSGTEVMGSCLSINGDPNINKSLLAYVLDGKNRLIAIKDITGRIVARTLIRLLWDPTATPPTPVLYQEPLYTDGRSDPLLQEALRRAVLNEASRLGIPLKSTDPQIAPYPHSLESLGSSALFEYSDAARRVTEGRFTVK